MIEQIAKFFRDVSSAYRWRRYWDVVGMNPEELRNQLLQKTEAELKEKLQPYVGMNMTAELQEQIEKVVTDYLAVIEDRLVFGTPAFRVVQKSKRPRLSVEDGRLIRNVDDLLTDLDPLEVEIVVPARPREMPAEHINLQLTIPPEGQQATAHGLTIEPTGEDRLVVGPPGLAVEGMERVVDTPEFTVHAEPDHDNGTYEVTVDENKEEEA